MRQCIVMMIQLHLSHTLVEWDSRFLIWLGSYRLPYDVDFSAKERY